MKAFVFPGQGAQFSGMGEDIYHEYQVAREMFEQANSILGFDLKDIMFNGEAEDLKQTKVTQPAIFLHSVALAKVKAKDKPDFVAGHSLGEFSALVAAGALNFEEALQLVSIRAIAMQKACEQQESTMAAILGLEDALVEKTTTEIDEVVVAANYNCPGQLVISGSIRGIDIACERLTEKGAKRALKLPVGGAFHSPLMEPAREELASAIEGCQFSVPHCPIVQNANAQASTDPAQIKENLIAQLTAPVRWTQSVQIMVIAGVSEFVEIGPGKVLSGLVKKIHPSAEVQKL